MVQAVTVGIPSWNDPAQGVTTATVIPADQFPGINAGQKINNAAKSLPSSGGTIDARGLYGPQAITQDMFLGITAPIELLLGAGTYTLGAEQNPPPNSSILGLGRGITIIQANPSFAGAAAISLNTSSRMAHLTLQGRNVGFISSGGGGVIGATNASNLLIEDCEILQWDGDAVNVGATVTNSIIRNNWIHHNFNEGIFVPQGSADCLIDGNYVFNNGFNGIDVNAQRVKITNNYVYANGQDTTHTPAFPQDHNGIFLYPFTGDAWEHLVIGNTVFSNAADGIHLAIGFAGTVAQFWMVANNHTFSNGTGGTTGGSGSGIFIDGSAAGDTFQNARILNNTSHSNQGWGMNISGAKAVRTEVRGNFFDNNVLGDYTDTGTNTVYDLNRTTASDVASFSSGVAIGSSGTTIQQIILFTATLSPASVAAASVGYQNFTVFGLLVAKDTIIKATAIPTPGLALAHWRVGGDNNVELAWVNPTALAVTPTASTVYSFWVFRQP